MLVNIDITNLYVLYLFYTTRNIHLGITCTNYTNIRYSEVILAVLEFASGTQRHFKLASEPENVRPKRENRTQNWSFCNKKMHFWIFGLKILRPSGRRAKIILRPGPNICVQNGSDARPDNPWN